MFREPGKKYQFALKVWEGRSALRCGQAFFRHFCSDVQHLAQLSPGFTCTSLFPTSSTNMKLSRRRFEGEDVMVAPWKGFSALF